MKRNNNAGVAPQDITVGVAFTCLADTKRRVRPENKTVGAAPQHITVGAQFIEPVKS